MTNHSLELVDDSPMRSVAATPSTSTVATPAALLEIAVRNGASIDYLDKLLTLRERWERAESEKAFNDALAAFKGEAVEILKRKEVDYASKGGRVSYKHAELSDVVEAIGPALSRCGFAWSWKTEQQGADWITVTCILKHRQGHTESVTLGGPPDESGGKNRIQGIGSTITYLQRYTLKAITGVAERGDDSDGRPTAAAAGAPTPAQGATRPGLSIDEAFAAASSIQDLAKIMNGLSATDKRAYVQAFNARRAELGRGQ